MPHAVTAVAVDRAPTDDVAILQGDEQESAARPTPVPGAIRTFRDMPISIHGSYDHLVLELRGLDRLRSIDRRVEIPLDSIAAVTLEPAGVAPVTWRLGPARHPGVGLTLTNGERYVIHRPDAAAVVDELVRRGVGVQLVSAVA